MRGGRDLVNENITISLCMIVKDEEQTIARCLESVKEVVDEIIIVDTGSTDQTKEIVKEHTPYIYDFEWIDDFAAARNFSFSKATKDYILWLDADDILMETEKDKLLQLKENLDPNVDAVSMSYYLAIDEKGKPTYSSVRNRLVKRIQNFQWIGFVHEYLAVYGNIMKSDIAIMHKKEKEHTDRNLRIFENSLREGRTFTPRDIVYYANECFDHNKYEKAIELYKQFLDGKEGWIEDCIHACGKLADCYKQLQKSEEALQACFHSFQYDIPRGEICCRIGHIFMGKEDYKQATFWYEMAINVPFQNSTRFIDYASYTWIPHLQLCVCYSRLGDNEKANYHNEQAAVYVPDHASVKYNQEYFRNLLKEDTQK
ncbi:glycosyltransferase family 2 protein [Bacillus cereus]|uniref:glycosyltransferase n=1 Tax=Bacillus sp. 123MFChir2 TaxID=1169144 RepID=UPI0005564FCA